MSLLLPMDDDTERLARQLAEATGKSVPEIVRQAIMAEAARAGLKKTATSQPQGLLARMTEITDGFARLPILDARSADEIIGYDEHGLPQ